MLVHREPDTDPTSAPTILSGNTIVSTVCRSLPNSSAETPSRTRSPLHSSIQKFLVCVEPSSMTEKSLPCASDENLAKLEEKKDKKKREPENESKK